MQRALFWFPLQNEDIREETDRGRFVQGSFRGFISDDQWRGPGIVRRCIANEPGPTTFALRNQCLEISYDPAFRPGTAPVLVELKDQNQGYTLKVKQLQNGQIP